MVLAKQEPRFLDSGEHFHRRVTAATRSRSMKIGRDIRDGRQVRKAAESGCSLPGRVFWKEEQADKQCLSVCEGGAKKDYWVGLDREVRAEGPNGALAKDYFNSEARRAERGLLKMWVLMHSAQYWRLLFYIMLKRAMYAY